MSINCLRRFLPAVVVPLIGGCAATTREAPSDLPDRLSRLEHERIRAWPSQNDTSVQARLVACDVMESPHAMGRNTAMPSHGAFVGVGRPAMREGLTVSPQRDCAATADATPQLQLGALWQDEPQAGSQPAGGDARETAPPTRSTARRPPLPRFWDTVERDLRELPTDLWRDTKRVYGSPANLVILGVSYGGALALQQTGPDDTIESHYDRSHSFKKDWRDAFGAAGNPGTHFALAGIWYLAGQQRQDEKSYEVGKTLFSALTINGLSVLLGQAATYDRSPNGERGTFPSGHTSSSFVVASVLHEAYGPWVGVPLYGLAGLVAVERLDSGEHYFSDVAFGAVMGMVVGHSVASGRDPEFFGWRLVPYADPATGTTGLALHKSF